MAALILPNRLVRQPQGAVRIDRSNPLGARVLCAFLGTRNVVSGASGTIVGSAARATDRQGAMTSLDGSSYIDLSTAGVFNDFAQPITIAYFSRPDSPPTYPGTLRIAPLAGADDFIILRSSDANYRFTVGKITSGAATGLPNFSTIPAPSSGVVERIVVTCLAGMVGIAPSNYAVWVNRTKYLTSSTTNFEGAAGAGTTFGWDGVDSKFAGLLDELVMFRGVLNEGEIARYYDNPWQLFAAPSRRMWVPEGALTPPPVGTLGEFDPGLRIAGWW